MPEDATPETFDQLIGSGRVVIDFWGTRCEPCLALMPHVEEFERLYAPELKVVKVNSIRNREACREFNVLGLPTFIFLVDGKEIERLAGPAASVCELRRAFSSLVELPTQH